MSHPCNTTMTSTPSLQHPLFQIPPSLVLFFLMLLPPPRSTLFPYTTLFRSLDDPGGLQRQPQRGRFFVRERLFRSGRSKETLRSEEHTSELQSHSDLVCRLLLEKKNEQTTRSR